MSIDLNQLQGQAPLAGQQATPAAAQPLAGATPPPSPAAGAMQSALASYAQLNQTYQQPLSGTPSYQPTAAPSPETLDQIGLALSAMDNHPINTQGPNPNSPVTNALSDGQAKRYVGVPGVLDGIWDNTVGQMIHQAQTNPGSLVPMILGGAAAIAATALVPELALPIWAGYALLSAPHILPQTINSIADAAHDPTDANVTAALINIGTAAITIGSPIKAFRGIGAARSVLEDGATALQTEDRLAGAATAVLGRPTLSDVAARPGEAVGDVRQLVDPTRGVEQYQVIPQTVDELEQEITKRSGGQAPVDVGDETVERLRMLLDQHGQLQRRVQEAHVPDAVDAANLGDDVAGALPDAKRTLDAFEQNDLIPAQRAFAHRYGYVLARENPLPQMSYEELRQIGDGLRGRVDRSFRAIWGVLHGAGDGHGWDGVSDGVVDSTRAANMAEAMARGMAGGGLEHAEAVLGTELYAAGRRLGVSDDRMEAVYRAIEGDATHDVFPSREDFERNYLYHGTSARAGKLALTAGHASSRPGSRFHLSSRLDVAQMYARQSEGGGGVGSVSLVHRSRVPSHATEEWQTNDDLEPTTVAWSPKVGSELVKPDYVIPGDVADPYGYLASRVRSEHYWDALSVPEKYLASKLATTFGIITNYAYKHGHIELPLQRYAPRILRREGVEYSRGGAAFLRNPGNVESRSWVADDWGVTNEMQELESHPDEELTLRPLADRLRQAVKTREQFQTQEDGRAQAFAQNEVYRNLLRQGDFGQELQNVRRMVGQRTKDLIPKAQDKIEQAVTRIADLERQIPQLDGQIRQIDQRLAPLRRRHGQTQQRDMLKSMQQDLIRQLRPLTRELSRVRVQHVDLTAQVRQWQQEVADAGDRLVGVAGGEGTARDLLNMDGQQLRDIAQGKKPGGRQLLTGYHLAGVSFGRFLRQMNQTRYREAWQSIARTTTDSTLEKAYGAQAPVSIQEINLTDPGQRPIAVPGDLPGGVPGAMLEGYVQVMPALGRDASALNYQPAIHARADVAARYKALAQEARSSSELKNSFSRGVYQMTVGAPKKLIMGSPAWHGKNVMGRYIALLVDQPSIATAALGRVLRERFLNPEGYYQTKLDHWMDGGVPANRHNVHEQLNHLEQQMTGQRTFLTAMKTAVGAIPHMHAKLAEGWFWKTVDDIGTAAYLTQKHRLMAKPWMSERVAGMLAAEYSNNVVGMVNPLYMGKLWKYGRQMAMFAPNWWTSFTRMAAQSAPGSARISHWLAGHPRLSALDPVKMHSLDIVQRKELVRMHRSYFLTYMAAGMAAHDLTNVILSGHHIWDNGKGRWWDLSTDLSHQPQGDPETQGVKHGYMSGDIFFSQMADLMNVIGLGHDWGFLSQMQGDGYKQADALHKIGIVAGALGHGLQQQAAGKVGLPTNEALGLGLGVDPYTLLRTGQAQQIPRAEALLSLLPAGSEAQVAIDDQRRLETRLAITGDPNSQAQLQQLQSAGELPGGVPIGPVRGALKSQFMGLPSLYYMGDEAPAGYQPLTDSQMTQYLQSRQTILQRKKLLSDQLMNGAVSPYDWVKQNEVESARYQQLLSDTFTQSSTQGRLWQAYDALNKKYNLDDPNLTQSQFYNLLDQRNADWNAQLGSYSPNAQAVWWDAHTSMWTDADYLHNLSTQTKDAIAGAIDGEGGNHIHQAQNKYSANGLPLTTSALNELRAQDPYLWTYYNVLGQMGKNTLLGSVMSAFSNPFASFQVIPDQDAQAVAAAEQAGILSSGSYVKQSTMAALGQAGRQVGASSAAEGGRLGLTPEGRQLGQGFSAEEAQQLLQNTNTSNLDPRIIALLEQIARG